MAAGLLGGCSTPDTAFLQGNAQEIAAETEKQKQLVLKQHYDYELRLQKVAFPLLTDNAEICGDKTAPYVGFSVWTIDTLPENYKRTAAGMYGLDGYVNVYMSIPGAPASRAGLQRGDKIIAVNGEPVQQGKSGLKQVRAAMRDRTRRELSLVVLRNGQKNNLMVRAAASCAFPVVMEGDGDVNAFADGKAVHIPVGMLRFTRTDEELALVVAHEIAHNAAEHVQKQMQNAMGAGLVGALLEVAIASGGGAPNGDLTRMMMEQGQRAYSVQFEQEADYIGMYILARAGYPIKNAADFWRRMASEAAPDTIQTRSTHPTSPERFVAIEKTAQEIARKISGGQSLLPNRIKK